MKTILNDNQGIQCMKVSQDNRIIISGCFEKYIIIQNYVYGKKIRRLLQSPCYGDIECLAINRLCTRIIFGIQTTLYL